MLRPPIDMALMARRAELSRFHFVRAFRDEFHATPHRYLQERRIERAKQAGGLSVTEVCFEVGFESVGSFSTLFHRLVGEPPGRYRAHRMFVWPYHAGGPVIFVPACYVRAYAPAA